MPVTLAQLNDLGMIPGSDLETFDDGHGSGEERLLNRARYFQVVFQALHLAFCFGLAERGFCLFFDFPCNGASNKSRYQ